MRITGLHIDGFGIFHDRPISDLNHELVVVYGNNEAGKSTLLGFIRAMFFGFPRANARDEIPYPPFSGGVHGGRIELTMAGGDAYTVTRGPGRNGGKVIVAGPGGRCGSASLLPRLLGGVGHDVFRNIFAFGLSELNAVNTIQGDGVQNAVYGTGFGAGAHSLPRVKKRLQRHMEALYKPGGTKPLINAGVAALEDVSQSLDAAGRQVERYDAAIMAREQTEERIGQVSRQLERQRRHHQRYGAYRRLWPEWLSLQEAEAAFASLTPVVTAFPEDGLARLDRESEACRKIAAEITDLSDRRALLRAQADRLQVDSALLSQAGAITDLFQKKSACIEQGKRLPALVLEHEALEKDIQSGLLTLGPDRCEEAVMGIDRSVFTREEIRTSQARYHQHAQLLAAAEQILADRKRRWEAAATGLRAAEKALTSLAPPPPAPDNRRVLQLKQGRDRFAESIREAADLTTRCARSRQDLARQLREINPSWQLADLNRFDTSQAARQQVASFSEGLAGAREAVRAVDARIQDGKDALARARARLRETRDNPVLPKTRGHWLMALPGMLAAGAAGRWCCQDPTVPAILASLVIGGYLVFLLKKIQADRERHGHWRRAMDSLAAHVAQCRTVLAAARNDRVQAAAHRLKITEAWRCHLNILGLDATMTPADSQGVFFKVAAARQQHQALCEREERLAHSREIEQAYRETAGALPDLTAFSREPAPALLQAVDGFIARLPEQDNQRETVRRAEAEAARCRLEKEAARAACDTARAQRNTLKTESATILSQWRSWLETHGLPPTLSPETALEALDTVCDIQTAMSRRDRLAGEIQQLEAGLSDYGQAVKAVFSNLHRPAPSEPESWLRLVDELMSGLNDARGNQREKAALENQLKTVDHHMSLARDRLRTGRAALRDLLAEAGTDQEAAFRQLGRTHARRIQLREARAENEKNMRRISGEFDMAALAVRLRALTLENIIAGENAADQAQSELARELDRLRDRRAELNQEISVLASDADMARLQADTEGLRTELRTHVFDYARYALANYLLDQAGKSFEKEHQPRIIQEAGGFFETFTNARYTRVMAPLGEKTIRAVRADDRRLRPEALSRGTAEQLYLAIRFGFIRRRALSREPLPVVMDDILVNFDPHRAEAATRAIGELSRTNQVFFFTCHPETVDRFQNTDARLINLNDMENPEPNEPYEPNNPPSTGEPAVF